MGLIGRMFQASQSRLTPGPTIPKAKLLRGRGSSLMESKIDTRETQMEKVDLKCNRDLTRKKKKLETRQL